MPIDTEKRYIFVHVPKVAGSAVTQLLNLPADSRAALNGRISEEERDALNLQRHFWHHFPATLVREFVGEEVFNSYYKFAFVRNPWDWAVSIYHYRKKRSRDEDFVERTGDTMEKPFDEWLRTDFQKIKKQSTYLEDEEGRMLMDFVGRFETIDADWAKIAQQINLPRKLPKVRMSLHRHYSEYYPDEALVDVVAQACPREIALFDYRFERPTSTEKLVWTARNRCRYYWHEFTWTQQRVLNLVRRPFSS